MARKRGGLAGLYDRNKGKFRVGAQLAGTAIGGLLGGPGGAKLGGSLAGAAMRGFDREGKSGIGFDVGQGLRGAAEGYATASLAGAAKGKIAKMLAPKAAAGAGLTTVPSAAMTAPNIGALSKASDSASMLGDIGRGATKALDFANKYEKPLGMAAKGVMSQLPDPQMQQQIDIYKRRQDLEERQFTEEQERRRRIAELLMPMYQQMMAGRGMTS